VRRLLILLALLCGLVWAVLVMAALGEGETRTMAQVRTAAGAAAFVLGAITSTGHKKE
jgi:hypothetical protein